jgi:hypothetical protein
MIDNNRGTLHTLSITVDIGFLGHKALARPSGKRDSTVHLRRARDALGGRRLATSTTTMRSSLLPSV